MHKIKKKNWLKIAQKLLKTPKNTCESSKDLVKNCVKFIKNLSKSAQKFKRIDKKFCQNVLIE